MKEKNPIAFKSASLVAIPYAKLEKPIGNNLNPYVFSVFQTQFGNIGCIAVSIRDIDLFENKDETVRKILEATEFAVMRGATTISYTGMLPASTRGLLDLEAAMKKSTLLAQYPKVRITTGHETVTSAFVMNIQRICRETCRDFNKEDVTFVGLGHIGTVVFELLLHLNYRPRSIRLVDTHFKRDYLSSLCRKAAQQYHYKNVEIVTIEKSSSIPKSVLNKSTFIIGASSSPNIINIDLLKPGTIIVDDSFPLSFDAQKAFKRIEKGEILITIAGALASKNPVKCLAHYSCGNDLVDESLKQTDAAISVDPSSMTGCVYSSVLADHFNLPCALGKVNLASVIRYFQCYRRHAFHGTPIYVFDFTENGKGSYFVASERIRNFREQYQNQTNVFGSNLALMFPNDGVINEKQGEPPSILTPEILSKL